MLSSALQRVRFAPPAAPATKPGPPERRRLVASLALALAGCGGDHEGEAPPSSTTDLPATSRATVEPLEDLLLWLVAPTPECPPSGFTLVPPPDDPTRALVQALGLDPNTQPACPRPPRSGL